MTTNEVNHNFSDSFQISSRIITDEGFVQADAIMSKVGIAEYHAGEFGNYKDFGASSPEEKIRVYRPASTLFNDATLKSFSNKPVTLGHPAGGEVNSKNAKSVSVGTIGDIISKDGDSMKSRITITDQKAIDEMESGKSFLSIGYKGKIIVEKGMTDSGENFDAKLVFMKGNHVALTERPRAGEDCKVIDEKKEVLNMSKVKINGIDVSINDEAVQAVSTLIDSNSQKESKILELEEKVKTLNDEKTKLEASNEVIKQKLESLNDEDLINSKVQERINLVDSVSKYIPEFEFSGKTDREIKVAAIKHFNDSYDDTDKCDVSVSATLEASIFYGKSKKESHSEVVKKINDSAFSKGEVQQQKTQKELAIEKRDLEINKEKVQ